MGGQAWHMSYGDTLFGLWFITRSLTSERVLHVTNMHTDSALMSHLVSISLMLHLTAQHHASLLRKYFLLLSRFRRE